MAIPRQRTSIARRPDHRRVCQSLVGLAVLCATACGTMRAAPPHANALRVGTSGDYPPFSLRAPDGSYSGFDIEVARSYAAARGRRLELIPFRWPELATRLATRDFDVAMSGVTVRADRLLVGTMTAAVARADAVLMVRKGARTAGGLERFDRSETRVAVNRGGHLEQVARAHLPHATLVTVDDNRSLPMLLREQKVAAIVTDTLEAATYVDDAFTMAARLTRDRKAYWVAPDETALATDLEVWLLARERDGTLARLRATHLRDADTPALPPAAAWVVDLVARRLSLMPLVAAAKRAADLPLVDRAREALVIKRAGEHATAAGLEAQAAERLARAQIAAARAVQTAAAPADIHSPDANAPTLAALRAGIDGLDAALLRALVIARDQAPTTAGIPVTPATLATALRTDANLPGFDMALAEALAAALADVLRPTPGSATASHP